MAEMLTREEILENLADLLRNGGDTARARAAEALLRQPEFQAGDLGDSDPFEALDAGDELKKAREKRSQAA